MLGHADTCHRDEHRRHHAEPGEVVYERGEEEPQPIYRDQVLHREGAGLNNVLRHIGGLACRGVVDLPVRAELVIELGDLARVDRHGDLVGDRDPYPVQDRREHRNEPDQVDEHDRRVGHLVADLLDPVQKPLLLRLRYYIRRCSHDSRPLSGLGPGVHILAKLSAWYA